MQHTLSTRPMSPLHNELRALSQEHHSPSSAAIHAALLISARTEVGYADMYTVIPRAENPHFATIAAQEMEARCPYLLAAIREAIAANRQRIFVEVLHANHDPSTNTPSALSAHAKLASIPHLVSWLLRRVQDAPNAQDSP